MSAPLTRTATGIVIGSAHGFTDLSEPVPLLDDTSDGPLPSGHRPDSFSGANTMSYTQLGKPDGGPAFPRVESVDCAASPGNVRRFKSAGGMTLRDYFIAHAPAQPAIWFDPVMEVPEPQPEWVGGNGVIYPTAGEAERASSGLYRDSNAAAAVQWSIERNKQWHIQWPGAWADAQLALRADPP